jgi:hypothetical protein
MCQLYFELALFFCLISKLKTMRSLFSTAGGKTILAGIIVVITGALAKAADCPYDNPILIVGVILAIVGGIMYASSGRVTD